MMRNGVRPDGRLGGAPPRGEPPRGGNPPAARSVRWEGHPWRRPETDAEWMLARQRWRGIQRIGSVLLLLALGVLIWTPDRVLSWLATSAPLRLPGAPGAALPWLLALIPWLQWGVIVGLLVVWGLVLHGGVRMFRLAQVWRTRATETWEPSFPATLILTPFTGIDLLVGWAPLLRPPRTPPEEAPWLVLALESAADGRGRLRVRAPRSRLWRDLVRHEIEGRVPGSTVRAGVDALQHALAGAGFLAWVDVTPARAGGAPLRDLGRFQSDPLGPLAAAVRVAPPVRYAAYDIVLHAVPPAEERRQREGQRMQIARIQARLTPGDLGAHAALMQHLEGVCFGAVIRCLAVADTEDAAVQQVQALVAALGQFTAETSGVIQRLAPVRTDALTQGRRRCFVVPCGADAPPAASFWRTARIPLLVGSAVGGVIGMGCGVGSGVAVGVILAGVGAALLGSASGVLAAALGGVGPAARQARARALVQAHAPRAWWPGVRLPMLPLPGTHPATLSALDLAALWHPPSGTLESLLALRPVRYLPPPQHVFLTPEEAAAAMQGTVLPPPTDPHDLGQRRLALALADHPDGHAGLVGPTLRDLRTGIEVVGPMGAGKSSFIEVLMAELARIGAGCILVDAKGDLADRVVGILPPEAQARTILVDLTAPSIPCLNPLDRRLAGDGVSPAQLIGQVETLFARMSPDIWRESAGMQQFARMGLRALLEGEPTPTLMHLDRFYVSSPYRAEVLRRVTNPMVRDFWLVEYPAMDPRVRVSIESFRRRLQHFITDPVVQQLFCQPAATLYLPDAMDARQIIIFKLVPEILSEALASILATALFATLVTATFARQTRQPDPDARWDCPLIIDEIQKFIDAEHPNDAEVFFTQTRALGVGIIGAHQGLYQYSEAVRSAALQALGGLFILGPIKQDARMVVEAYANTGLTEADLAAVRAREEALVRFPVRQSDSGLFSARPRHRPQGLAVDGGGERGGTGDGPYRWARPADPDPEVDRLLERAWATAAQGGAHHGATLAAVRLLDMLGPQGTAAAPLVVERLAQRAQAIRATQAAALAADPRQIPDPRARVRELSMLRYGVDPVIAALRTHALARRWEADGDALAPARAPARSGARARP